MTTRTIHVVDDDDAVRDSIRMLLASRSNLLIRCYKSGRAFLEQVDDLESGVLLLDHHMPDVSGLEVLQAIDRERFLTIMLTGHGTVGLAMDVIRAGGVDFLEKPYDPALLLKIVDAAFDKLEKRLADEERVAAARTKIERLSDRERSVLECLIDGHSNKLIAHTLDISPRTVEIHRANLMGKLQVRSLSEALRISFAAGLLAPHDRTLEECHSSLR